MQLMERSDLQFPHLFLAWDAGSVRVRVCQQPASLVPFSVSRLQGKLGVTSPLRP